MSMKQTLDVLNAMHRDGVIGPYALAGAVAAFNYLEPAVTDDLDVLISFQTKSGLIDLAPVFDDLRARGYETHQREGIVIEGWPVQFIPAVDELDAEALANAEDIEIKMPSEAPVRTRILQPEYLAAIALRVGRAKDQFRIAQFLEEKAVSTEKLCAILRRHDLIQKWQSFCARAGINDPCRVE